MGREIRMVPPNWQHPQWTKDDAPEHHMIGRDKAMYDEHFDDAFAKWLEDFDRVRAGNLTKFEREYTPTLGHWCHDNHSPDPDYCRPWRDEEATWFQLWQTVSEGSPVSPAFATKAELIDYLAAHGDFWDQKRGDGPWSRENAERFVNGAGWAPSLIVQTGPGGGIFAPRDGEPKATEAA